MATNPPKNNARIGVVKNRTQLHNPQINRWVKRDTTNGQFMDVKANQKKFKGVRREK